MGGSQVSVLKQANKASFSSFLVRLSWQYPGTLYPLSCSGQSPGQVSWRVVCKWGVWWPPGTSRFLRVPLCPVSSDVLSGHFWHWESVYLCMRVVLVLERPCLDLMIPSSLLFMLGSMVSELPIASVLCLWPVVLWLGKYLGVLLVGPLLGPLLSFLLLDLLWVSLLHARNIGFPTGWILGVI